MKKFLGALIMFLLTLAGASSYAEDVQQADNKSCGNKICVVNATTTPNTFGIEPANKKWGHKEYQEMVTGRARSMEGFKGLPQLAGLCAKYEFEKGPESDNIQSDDRLNEKQRRFVEEYYSWKEKDSGPKETSMNRFWTEYIKKAGYLTSR